MELEYDIAKRTKTLLERGLGFARADEVFAGFHFTVEDQRLNYGETRYQTIGLCEGIEVMLVWTLRELRRRIISMRRCDEDERNDYRRYRGLDGP